MLANLLSHAGVIERMSLRSSVGLMAIHGGSLERETDVIAAEVSHRTGASHYAVCLPEGLRWHVPSHRFDAGASSQLDRFLAHVHVAISLHGFGREGLWTSLLVGGANRLLAAEVARALRAELPDYRVIDDLDEIPPPLRGLDPRNPANRAKSGGVHLELPLRVRGLGPYWDRRPTVDPNPHRAALVNALCAVVRQFDGTSTAG